MNKNFSIILLSFMLMSGCAHQEWMRLGATQADLGRDQYGCMQGAMASAPPIISSQVVWDGGQHKANWDGKSGKDVSNGGGGRVEPVDVNAGNREALLSSCMQAKGWQLITVKDQ